MSENLNTNPSDQHNQGGLVAFVASMIFVFGFMFYLVAFDKGVVLNENVVDPHAPGAAAAMFDVTQVAEPWVSSDEMIAHGKKVYLAQCALCHGNEAKGNGPGGMGLNPRPRDLVEGKWTQGGGHLNHFKVITNGIPGTSMAAFKAQTKIPDRWAIVHFIESVTQNKSKDDPAQVAEFAKSYKD